MGRRVGGRGFAFDPPFIVEAQIDAVLAAIAGGAAFDAATAMAAPPGAPPGAAAGGAWSAWRDASEGSEGVGLGPPAGPPAAPEKAPAELRGLLLAVCLGPQQLRSPASQEGGGATVAVQPGRGRLRTQLRRPSPAAALPPPPMPEPQEAARARRAASAAVSGEGGPNRHSPPPVTHPRLPRVGRAPSPMATVGSREGPTFHGDLREARFWRVACTPLTTRWDIDVQVRARDRGVPAAGR